MRNQEVSELVQAMEVLENQELLKQFKSAAYPHMESIHQKDLHNYVSKKARIAPAREMSTKELYDFFKGGINGKQ